MYRLQRLSTPAALLASILGTVAVGAVTVIATHAVVRAAARVSFLDLEESLTCQCGCGLTVHSCNHLQCPSAIPLRKEIREQMALGKTKEQILAYFSNKYGEKILSAPTTRGFNLVAWVTPFILVLIGGVFVGITLMRWSKRAPAPADTAPEAPRHAPTAYDKILEKELKNFDG